MWAGATSRWVLRTSLIVLAAQSAHAQKHSVAAGGVVFDGDAGENPDRASLDNVVGVLRDFGPGNGGYDVTASFFRDHIFGRAHSIALSGPRNGTGPVPRPDLAAATRIDLPDTAGTRSVVLHPRFDYDPAFFFRPRGRIDGFIHFPGAGGSVEIQFGIERTPDSAPPAVGALESPESAPAPGDFFFGEFVNTGGAGNIIAFSGQGIVPVGFLEDRGRFGLPPPVFIYVNVFGSGASVFLPGSAHIDFDTTIPEPAFSLAALGGCIALARRRAGGGDGGGKG